MFEKLVLIKCQTFAENYFMKLLFPKFGTFLCFRRSKHNYHLANKKLSSNRIPFDSCLIMKNWYPQKWLALLYSTYIYVQYVYSSMGIIWINVFAY